MTYLIYIHLWGDDLLWCTAREKGDEVNEKDKQIQTLIEEFWEFESGWGASQEAVIAACKLQLGYKTEWDEQRLKVYNKVEGELRPIGQAWKGAK